MDNTNIKHFCSYSVEFKFLKDLFLILMFVKLRMATLEQIESQAH
jgi:hypothetical protein